MENMNKLKLVSINYTWDCFRNPRCHFCYVNKYKIVSMLKEKKVADEKFWEEGGLWNYNCLKNTEQVSIAYNGVQVRDLINLTSAIWQLDGGKTILNITTHPDFVTPQIVGLFDKLFRVSMVCLSLAPDASWLKQLKSWENAVDLIKKSGIKIATNILMLNESYNLLADKLKDFEEVFKVCSQVHFLRPKLYKLRVPLEQRKNMLALFRLRYPNVFIDECFKQEFEGAPCRRGEEFVAINPDGMVTACSFDNEPFDKKTPENSKTLERCPFLAVDTK